MTHFLAMPPRTASPRTHPAVGTDARSAHIPYWTLPSQKSNCDPFMDKKMKERERAVQ
jgi:hypothetical protein